MDTEKRETDTKKQTQGNGKQTQINGTWKTEKWETGPEKKRTDT